MKRTRDEPTVKYSCYTYDGNEEAPSQHLHFVDVGLRFVSQERLVDPLTRGIVPGVVGADAAAVLSAPPTPPPQGGSEALMGLTPQHQFQNRAATAQAATGLRNMEQRLQPVAKGFPALQYFSCPRVVGADAHATNEELSVYYVGDEKHAVSRAVQGLAAAAAASGGAGTSEAGGGGSCPYHYFRCACSAYKLCGTALRRLYEEFNGAFDWDVYVAEEEARRGALTTSNAGHNNNNKGATSFPTTQWLGAAPNFMSLATDSCSGATTSQPTSPTTAQHFPLFTAAKKPSPAGNAAFSKQHSSQSQQVLVGSPLRFRPSLVAPRPHAYGVGSGLQRYVEIKPISPSLVAGNDYWYHCLAAYDRYNNSGGGDSGQQALMMGSGSSFEDATSLPSSPTTQQQQHGSAVKSPSLDIEAIQCLYEAFVGGTEEDLLTSVTSREGLMTYRHRQLQQKWLSPMLQQQLMMAQQQQQQQRAALHSENDNEDVNFCSTSTNYSCGQSGHMHHLHPLHGDNAAASPLPHCSTSNTATSAMEGIAPLAVVLFLNVSGFAAAQQPDAHANSSSSSTSNGSVCATHAAIFITTPNAPLTLARRVIGPIPLQPNDSPLSIMSALALHTRQHPHANTTTVGTDAGSSAANANANHQHGTALEFPRCSTCKRCTVGLVYCPCCSKNRVCPPPSAPTTAGGTCGVGGENVAFAMSLLGGSSAASPESPGCYLQYQCSLCGTVTCANCCVRMTVNGISGKKCLECLTVGH